MNFDSLHDMIEYIEKNTDNVIVNKTNPLKDDNMNWLYTEQGIEILNKLGFFKKQQVLDKIEFLFCGFDCKICTWDTINDDVCEICYKIKHIIQEL